MFYQFCFHFCVFLNIGCIVFSFIRKRYQDPIAPSWFFHSLICAFHFGSWRQAWPDYGRWALRWRCHSHWFDHVLSCFLAPGFSPKDCSKRSNSWWAKCRKPVFGTKNGKLFENQWCVLASVQWCIHRICSSKSLPALEVDAVTRWNLRRVAEFVNYPGAGSSNQTWSPSGSPAGRRGSALLLLLRLPPTILTTLHYATLH